jgi:hypothetical protein
MASSMIYTRLKTLSLEVKQQMAESRAYKRLKAMHPTAHWQRFESWSGVGVFDSNACQDGVEIWVENKEIKPVKNRHDDWLVKTKVRPSQVAWEALRRRAGGKTFVALVIGPDLCIIEGKFMKELKEGIPYKMLCMILVDPRSLFIC